MNEELAGRALAAYGIEYSHLLAVEKGYRNESHPLLTATGERLNLIIYKREPDILARVRRANRVANALAAQGFPARCTYDPRILQLRAGGLVRYAALYTYLPGATIPWEAYTKDHIKLVGQTLSDMHTALRELPAGDLPAVADEYAGLLERMERYFSQPGVKQAMAAKLQLAVDPARCAYYKDVMRASKSLGSQQVLHMDFVRGNILFADQADKPVVSGILDFEKTAYGPRLFDIARTLAFLLVDCKYKSASQVRKYFLHSGYQKRGASQLPAVTIKQTGAPLLEPLVTMFLLYDFYKFLRHNPYESLEQNEHFVRTRNFLLSEVQAPLIRL